jgi:hypothetical protein
VQVSISGIVKQSVRGPIHHKPYNDLSLSPHGLLTRLLASRAPTALLPTSPSSSRPSLKAPLRPELSPHFTTRFTQPSCSFFVLVQQLAACVDRSCILARSCFIQLCQSNPIPDRRSISHQELIDWSVRMPHFSSLLQGLARSLSVGRERKPDAAGDGKAAPALRSSGTVWGEGSETFAAVCSRRGEKGINQDCAIVLEVSLSIYLSDLFCLLN